jgi:hypothetical protein
MGWHSMTVALPGAACLVIALAASAAPEQLKGMRFIDVMQGNTVSGTTASGAAFNLYFVAGGEVTYEDSSGARDRGRWQMDPDGDVCITWRERHPDRESCYRVTVDGDQVSWEGKEGSGEALLRGGVGSSFLKRP